MGEGPAVLLQGFSRTMEAYSVASFSFVVNFWYVGWRKVTPLWSLQVQEWARVRQDCRQGVARPTRTESSVPSACVINLWYVGGRKSSRHGRCRRRNG